MNRINPENSALSIKCRESGSEDDHRQQQLAGPNMHQRSHAMTREKKNTTHHVEAERSMDAVYDDINESADAFIKRFRQHLQIQRLESIENYKQMLTRGL